MTKSKSKVCYDMKCRFCLMININCFLQMQRRR